MIPRDLKFTKDHEWVRLDGDRATVGITDHAQSQLGDITFVDAPSVGREVAQDGPLGAIESVKAASDIYAPVSGRVAEINPALAADPGLVNREPYAAGWICRLDGVREPELAKLMDAAAYEAFTAQG